MKKILHISKYYPPYAGGIEDVCYTIVNILNNKSDQYTQKILCFNNGNKTICDKIQGVEVIRVGVDVTIFSQAFSFSYFKEFKKILSDFKPDFIHFHLPNPFASIPLLMLIPQNVKLILHWHGDIVEQKYLYNLIKPIEKKLLKRGDKVIVTSENYGNNSKPLANFQNKCLVIPNVIIEDKFTRTAEVDSRVHRIKEKYNHKAIVLFIGRHVPYKGLEFFIDSLKYLQQDCQIVIGGQGCLTKMLKNRAKEFSNVDFVGRIPEEDIAAYYYASSVFALPSITKGEAFGVVLAEAMYCKIPAVTFTIEGSGVNWVSIHNNTGIEVENKNVKEYAKAIDNLLCDKKLQEQMGKNAHSRVINNFTIDRIKSQILALYNA